MLRRRAERAIDEGRGRLVIEPLLEAILERAADDDPVRSFAHRHMAELILERDPWTAALHLRKALAQHANDDVSHSLMALAQALLGNYRAGVSAYRRALKLSPRNPWYHHNLGHLLDVALDDPRGALPHLEIALEQADETEHEITASAAHCYARTGDLVIAERLAKQALAGAPNSGEHRALLEWIQNGAPADKPVHPLRAETRAAGPRPGDGVVSLLEHHLVDAGFTRVQVTSARALWNDYRDQRSPRVKKPEVCAAAVHYAIATVLRERVTQTALARRYGVTAGSVSSRYTDIRDALSLRPGDPRYGG